MKITRENYYQNTTHVSYHDLCDFRFCEYLFQKRKEGVVKDIETDPLKFGKAYDAFVSGEFDERYSVGRKAEEGKERVTDTVLKHIQDCKTEVYRHPLIGTFERNKGNSQVIITTEIAGIKVRGMLDVFDKERKIIVDDKTTASIAKFNPMMYAEQLAWYQMLVERRHGITADCFIVVVDKDTYTKHARFYKFSQSTLDAQKEFLIETLKKLNETRALGLYEPTDSFEKCLTCPFFNQCPYTIQKEFIEV